jgi:dienelactone hydrolase
MRNLATIAALILFWTISGEPASSAPGLTPVTLGKIDSGKDLVGWLSLPAGKSGPVPAVVLLHGCSGIGTLGSIYSTYHAWTKILDEAGYAVLLVDSMGPRDYRRTCGAVPGRAVMYRERPGDAYAGLRYLQSLDAVDASQIFLIGWSQGGGMVLLTMNTQSIGRPAPAPARDFKAAVAFYPAACSYRLQHRPYTQIEPGT